MRHSFYIFTLILVTACGTPGVRDGAPVRPPADLVGVPDAVPKPEPLSAYGNPATYKVLGKTYQVRASRKDYKARGLASWYGTKFHGRRTSSGEPYDMYGMTAAHKTLPLPTYARVTNLDNGKSVIVKINDRGPFHANRIIDLSYTAAAKLDMLKNGTARVEVVSIVPETITAAAATPTAQTNQSGLFVQAGAFSEKENAEQVKRTLANAAIESDIYMHNLSPRQIVYRVQIGPFNEINDANRITDKLNAIGISDAHIVTQ
jgi:rare lipoprotein A